MFLFFFFKVLLFFFKRGDGGTGGASLPPLIPPHAGGRGAAPPCAPPGSLRSPRSGVCNPLCAPPRPHSAIAEWGGRQLFLMSRYSSGNIRYEPPPTSTVPPRWVGSVVTDYDYYQKTFYRREHNPPLKFK